MTLSILKRVRVKTNLFRNFLSNMDSRILDVGINDIVTSFDEIWLKFKKYSVLNPSQVYQIKFFFQYFYCS